MSLTSHQRRYLKGLAHKLTPSAHLGKNGMTASFKSEVSRQLKDRELIKVRIGAEARPEFLSLADELRQATDSYLVETIGRIAILYRESDEPEIKLPRS